MEALQNLKNRIMTMIGRCILAATKDDGDFQIVQLKGFGDVSLDGVKRYQNYGLATNVPPGAKGIKAAIGSNHEDLAVLILDHPEFRVKNLKNGEVVLFDKNGQQIFFKENGTIEVKGNEKVSITTKELLQTLEKLTVAASTSISMTTGTLSISNDTAELIASIKSLCATLEGAQVMTLTGMQSIIPGGETFTVLKEKVGSFEGGA